MGRLFHVYLSKDLLNTSVEQLVMSLTLAGKALNKCGPGILRLSMRCICVFFLQF